MGEYRFSINVGIDNMPDPESAIEWFMQHLSVSTQAGELVVRCTGPEGEGYLWRPQPGKPPAEWLERSWPAGTEA
ncbi:hypothetical protein [Nocardioides mangrovi]|uniref:VOC family protein n=1 Tax=Nocardioides mangrovi TaxID=2874580 RepID=A0ABS7UFW5_9ACTN|nr:hypothetical protein [Nocardioides mangrovi]MBZ5739762.1 hypothetical protein [Nocardioides mangrovi]